MRQAARDEQTLATGNRNSARWLLGILLVALVVRVAAVLVFQALPSVTLGGRRVVSPAEQPLFPDALEYLKVTKNILLGRGLMVDEASRIGRMPGYPVFLALVQSVCGESLLAVRLVQAVVGTGVVWLVWLLAREVYGERQACLAAAVAAVYPYFVLFTPLVLAETVFMALFLWGALCLKLAYSHGRWVSAVLAGVFLGLATLVRASLLPFVLLAAAVWVVLGRLERGAFGRAAALLVAFGLVMAPWVVRNYYASGGHVVPTTLRAGPSLYEALNPEADGGPMMDRIDWGDGTEGLSEYEQNRLWRARAVAFVRGSPAKALALAGRKLVRFWNVVPNYPPFRVPLLCVVVGVPYVAVMLLAAVGLVRSWRRGDVNLILLLPVVYYALLHMVFVGSVRYRVPVMPLVIIIAAHGLVALMRHRFQKAP